MRLDLTGVLLVSLCSLACSVGDDPKNGTPAHDLSARLSASLPDATKFARMEEYLESRYSPADVVHRFVNRGGDEIDCVLRERQPALRDPAMAGRPIQTPPSLPAEPVYEAPPGARPVDPFFDSGVDKTGNVRTCPLGSVPIPRLTLDDLKRFGSIEAFFRKAPDGAGSLSGRAIEPRSAPAFSRWYAVGRQRVWNVGAVGVFNVWLPAVYQNNEFSLYQMWVMGGSAGELQTVEVGWQRYPDHYGDDSIHVFIYYTPDDYQHGCYNLDCPAFVIYDANACIGCAAGATSIDGGTQYESQLSWVRSPSGAWWLRWFSTWWGYYPAGLFSANGLGQPAAEINFGGEIFDNVVGTYTPTDMGSGQFPAAGFSHAAYQRNLQYRDTSYYGDYHDAGLLYDTYWGNLACWDIASTTDFGSGTHFYFGGPGYNGTTCNGD